MLDFPYCKLEIFLPHPTWRPSRRPCARPTPGTSAGTTAVCPTTPSPAAGGPWRGTHPYLGTPGTGEPGGRTQSGGHLSDRGGRPDHRRSESRPPYEEPVINAIPSSAPVFDVPDSPTAPRHGNPSHALGLFLLVRRRFCGNHSAVAWASTGRPRNRPPGPGAAVFHQDHEGQGWSGSSMNPANQAWGSAPPAHLSGTRLGAHRQVAKLALAILGDHVVAHHLFQALAGLRAVGLIGVPSRRAGRRGWRCADGLAAHQVGHHGLAPRWRCSP